MAFDVSSLTNYTAENQFPLMRKTVLGAKMMSLATVVPSIKGPSKLPQIAQTIFFQEDGCSFNASGDTAFSQRTLTPGKVKINDSWCPKDLEPKYFAQEMRAGAHYENVTPEYVWQSIMEEYADKVSNVVDVAVWQGDTVSGSGNNSHWDGFITLLSSGTTDADPSNTISDLGAPSQAVDAQWLVYNSASLLGLTQYDDFRVFLGYDDYAALVQGLNDNSITYGTMVDGTNGDKNVEGQGLTMFGTNLKVVPVAGLTGQNKLYAGRLSNFFVGVDAEGDFTNFETWYSQDDRVVKLAIEFKLGCQVAFPDEIITIIP